LPKKNPKREESKCQTCQNCYAHKCSFIKAIFPEEIEKSLKNKNYKIYTHRFSGCTHEDKSYKVLQCPDYLPEINKKNFNKAV